MIRILAKEYSQAVQTLCVKLDKESAAYDVYFTRAPSQLSEMLTESVSLSALILVGDTGRWCNTFAQTFGLALVYDKFAEQNIRKYCKLSGLPLPAQYLLDKYCMQPETFIHSVPVYGFQCGCMGEYGKCHVYVMPDNSAECESIFDNYLAKDLFRSSRKREVRIYKIFGLSARDLEDKLAKEKDDYLRLMAEFDNFRRRTSQEKLELVSSAAADTIKGLLPVLDDFERAIKALQDSQDSSAAKEGTELIYNKLMGYLKTKGLAVIESMGKEFDTDMHEAVAQFPVEEEDRKGKVYDVVQTGYTLNGKVIRFAKVVVAI